MGGGCLLPARTRPLQRREPGPATLRTAAHAQREGGTVRPGAPFGAAIVRQLVRQPVGLPKLAIRLSGDDHAPHMFPTAIFEPRPGVRGQSPCGWNGDVSDVDDWNQSVVATCLPAPFATATYRWSVSGRRQAEPGSAIDTQQRRDSLVMRRSGVRTPGRSLRVEAVPEVGVSVEADGARMHAALGPANRLP